MDINHLTLLTDLYELTMMQGYFKTGNDETVVFDVFYRDNPSGSGYAITCGLDQVIDYIKNLSFSYDDIEKAKKCTFLKVYNDLFYDNFGIKHSTLKLNALDGTLVGRGCILKKDEMPEYERFIPKKEFIKNDNRFSPPGVEWLYLALGNESDIHQCAQAECRAHVGDDLDSAISHLKRLMVI